MPCLGVAAFGVAESVGFLCRDWGILVVVVVVVAVLLLPVMVAVSVWPVASHDD